MAFTFCFYAQSSDPDTYQTIIHTELQITILIIVWTSFLYSAFQRENPKKLLLFNMLIASNCDLVDNMAWEMEDALMLVNKMPFSTGVVERIALRDINGQWIRMKKVKVTRLKSL